MQLDRTIAPPVFEIDPITLTLPEKKILENGLPVHYFKKEQFDLIHFDLVMTAGTVFQPAPGVAGAVIRLLKKSSPTHSAQEMEQLIDFYGASWGIRITDNVLIVRLVIPKSNCEALLPHLMELILNPKFKQSDLDVYVSQRITSLEIDKLEGSYIAREMRDMLLYEENSPYGTILTKQHYKDLTVNMLESYFERAINSSTTSLYVAGSIDLSLEKLIESYFSKIKKGEKLLITSPLLKELTPRSVFHELPDCKQSTVMLFKKGLPHEHPDRESLSFVQTLLHGTPFSRLMNNLRGKHGLTYGVSGGSLMFFDYSIMIIETEVVKEGTNKALEQIFFELQRLREEPVSQEEFKQLVRTVKGKLYRQLNGIVAAMRVYQHGDLFGGGENMVDSAFQALAEFNVEKIQYLANQHLQETDFFSIVVGQK
ncbi:MAG TPA: insulinase family protein [Bacteroidales bacterium]|nr:insulinase family protein [Bacteroidales bacterium]HQB75275.1 insulinase family protein [Bacteroidales bacterium]